MQETVIKLRKIIFNGLMSEPSDETKTSSDRKKLLLECRFVPIMS